MAGSIRSLRRPRRRASVRSSSAPASRLYPTTSATRIAASFRLSPIAPLSAFGDYHERSAKSPGLQAVARVGEGRTANIGPPALRLSTVPPGAAGEGEPSARLSRDFDFYLRDPR